MRETLVKTEEFKDLPVGRIPKDWEVVKLESLLNGRPKNGYSPKEVNEWTGTLMLGLGCLTEEGFEPCQLKNAPSNDLKIRAALLSDGDFLLSRSNTRERVALAGIYRDVGVPCIYSDLMMRLSLNEKICSRFMELLLRHSSVRRQLTGNAQGTSGSMVKISSQTVMETVVLLPPRKEQDRIISVMDILDKAIAQTSSLIAKLKQMKAGLLHDLLTRGLDENGEFRDAIAHPEQFKDSPLGQIPKDWEVVPLTTLCHKITDGSHQSVKTSDSGVPFLYVSCVRDGQILWEQAAKIPEQTYAEISKGREPVPGLILYTAVGSYGHAALVREKYQFSFQRHIAYILANSESVEPAYLTMWLNSPQGRKYADQVALGNAQKTVTLGELASFPVLLPEIEEQRRITEILDAHNTRIRSEEAYREKLKLQKQGLMHDLLTGKVRVKI